MLRKTLECIDISCLKDERDRTDVSEFQEMRMDITKRNEQSPFILYKTTSPQQETRELHSRNIPTTSTLTQRCYDDYVATPSHTIYEELKYPSTTRREKHIKKIIRQTNNDTFPKYEECKPCYVRKTLLCS